MPAIPLKISERSASDAGTPNRSYSDVKANDDMFGGGVGNALAKAGDAAAGVFAAGADIVEKDKTQQRNEHIAQTVAQTDMITPSMNARQAAPADGSGVAQSTWDAQRAEIDRVAEEQFAGDPKGASEYKQRMYPTMGSIRNTNVQFEFGQRATYNKEQADNGLNVIYNGLRADPSLYDDSVRRGTELIDASSSVPASEKETAKTVFRQNAANTRFDGQLFAAKTVDDIKGVEKELQDEKWQAALTPEQYKNLTQKADSQKKVFQTKAASETTTLIATMRTRLDDPEAPPLTPADLETVRRKVEASGSEVSTASMVEFSKLAADNEIKIKTRGLPAYQIAELRNRSKGGPDQTYPGLPPEMSSNVNKVAGMFPGVSAGYLGATATVEYGGNFKKDGTTNYGIKSDTSSAQGVYQFTTKTWNDTVNNPGVKAVLEANGFKNIGPDTRNDPLASTIAAAALASQNKSILVNALHRDVSDSELYMAHFFGAGTAAKFISNYTTNRDGSAAAVAGAEAADANKSIFYTKDGRARSVAEVYDLFTTRFSASPSQAQYNAGQTYDKIYKGAVKAQTDNPVAYAANQGTHSVTPLDQPSAFEARGSTFRDIGTYYRIPDADNKPFDSATEVPQLKKQIADGTAEQVATLLSGIGAMDKTGPGAAAAGLAQLGEKNTSYGVAAQLMQGGLPNMDTATTIIRGQKQIDAGNKTALGDKSEADDTFNKTVGTALNFLDPKAREALQRAAEAHYVQTAGAGDGKFVAKQFAASVNAVMGGSGDRIGEVNSVKTVLPKGVDENTFEKAVDNLTPQALIASSVDRKGNPNGMAPMYSDGTNVSATDIAVQGKFRYVGSDIYEVYMADNKRLVTANIDPATGGRAPYWAKMDKNTVTSLAQKPGGGRPQPVADLTGTGGL